MTNYIKKLLALAVTVGAMTARAEAVAYTGDYAKFSYSKIINWRGTAAAFHSGRVTELQADGTEGAEYNMTANQNAQSWQRFAENQSAYAAPGLVLRLDSSTATKGIEAAFSPWTIGGLIVEADGYSFGPQNHTSRGVTFGDPTGATETYVDIHKDFTIKRGSTEANFKSGFFGTVNVTIDAGKVFDYNSLQSNHQLLLHTTWPRVGTAVNTCLKMHGDGTLKVATLTATGDVTLDFSDLATRVNTEPFIDGDLTIDGSTCIIFPSTVGSGVPLRLCSGTLNYNGEPESEREVRVGDTVVNAKLSFDVDAATVTYTLPQTKFMKYYYPLDGDATNLGTASDEGKISEVGTSNWVAKEGCFQSMAHASNGGTIKLIDAEGLAPEGSWALTFRLHPNNTTGWSDACGFKLGERVFKFERRGNGAAYDIFYNSTEGGITPTIDGSEAWHNIIVMPNTTQGGFDVYVDGTLNNEGVFGDVADGLLTEVLIGTDGVGGGRSSPALVSDVAVYDYLLSAEEIAKLQTAAPQDFYGPKKELTKVFTTIDANVKWSELEWKDENDKVVAWKDGLTASIEIAADATLTLDTEGVVPARSMILTGAGNLDIVNYEKLPTKFNATQATGMITCMLDASAANVTPDAAGLEFIRGSGLTFRFLGSETTGVHLDFPIGAAIANPIASHLVFEAGHHKMLYRRESGNLFATGHNEANPTVLVKNGATLDFGARDISGWSGGANITGVIRVNDGGKLNFYEPSESSGTFFYRQRLYLDPGAYVSHNYSLNGSEGKFRWQGGTAENTAQIYVPASTSDMTDKPAVIEQKGASALVLASDSTRGLAIYVGENSKLQLKSEVRTHHTDGTVAQLHKYGAGELEFIKAVDINTLNAHAGKLVFAPTGEATFRVSNSLTGNLTIRAGENGIATVSMPSGYTGTTIVESGRLQLTSTPLNGNLRINEGCPIVFPAIDPGVNLTLCTGTFTYGEESTGTKTLSGATIYVGTATLSADVAIDFTNKTISYSIASNKTLARRQDFDGMTEEDYLWTAPGSWIDGSGAAVDWPAEGVTYANINADLVAKIIVDTKVKSDMITLTNSAAEEGAEFRFETKEPLDEVADLSKTDPDYIINGKLSAGGFSGDLYLQSRIEKAVMLGDETRVFFVAGLPTVEKPEGNPDEETTAYPYTFENLRHAICKIGPGKFIVPSSMYTYDFNVRNGELIYDIPTGEELTFSSTITKDANLEQDAVCKLVKRGAGTMLYTPNLSAGFMDDFVIEAGTVKLSRGSQNYNFWNGTPVAVTVDGGTLDMNGKTGFKADIVLKKGSTLKNSGALIGEGEASIHAITLEGDATIDSGANGFGLLANGYNATTLNLNGHTLTKSGNSVFFFCNTTMSAQSTGTIVVEEGTLKSTHTADDLSGASVEMRDGTILNSSAQLTVGSLVIAPTTIREGTALITAKNGVSYVGAADSTFTWVDVALGAGATTTAPTTAFTMNVPAVPANQGYLPAHAKVKVTITDTRTPTNFPIGGVSAANVTVIYNNAPYTGLSVETTDHAIIVAPATARKNPVTGDAVLFTNYFKGTVDNDWSTLGNWYTLNDGGEYVAYTGTVAPMKAGNDSLGWAPAIIDGEQIETAANRNVTLDVMEGWNLRLGLFGGAKVTVETLTKIQGNAGTAMYIMVDESSKLTFDSVQETKTDAIAFYVAAADGIVFNSAFNKGNAIDYHLAGEGSVKYAAGVTAGTHTISRFDFALGDKTKPVGVIAKKLISLPASTTVDFALAANPIVTITDAADHPGVHPVKSVSGLITAEDPIGTYKLAKRTDGIYILYKGYGTNAEKTAEVIDSATTLSSYDFTGVSDIIVNGAESAEDVFDVVFDRVIPDNVTFRVNGYVNFKTGGSVTELPVAPIVADEGSCIGIAAPFDADYAIAANRTVRIVENMTLTHYLRPASGSGVVEIAPNVTLTESANSQINNHGIFRIYGTLNIAGFTQEWNSFNNECKVYLFAGATITGTDAGRVKTTGGYDTTFFVKDFDGASEKVVTFDIGTNHGAYDVAINYEIDPGVGFKFLRNTENTNLTATGTNIPYLEVAGNANMKVANNSGCLTGTVKTSGTASIVLQGNNAFASTANLHLPATLNIGSTTQSFNGAITVESGTATVPAFVTNESEIVKKGAGKLILGSMRPIMDVQAGSVQVTASEAEIESGELYLSILSGAAAASDSKLEVVSAAGETIPVKSVEKVTKQGVEYIKVTLGTSNVTTSTSVSEMDPEILAGGGTIAITGGNDCESAIDITFDMELPENVSFTISKHVNLKLENGGEVTALPMGRITLNAGACVGLFAPLKSPRALVIPADVTVAAHRNMSATLTNNGTFIVKNGATATITAASAESIRGTIEIEHGATFVNQTNDAIAYSGEKTVFNVRGTLDMGTTRWTVGGDNTESAINLYGGAEVVGVGNTTAAGVYEGTFDLHRSGNVISIFKGEGEQASTDTVTIEGGIRVRNTAACIWIAEGMKLGLTGGIMGADTSGAKVTRKGAGHLTGEVKLIGGNNIAEFDYGEAIATHPEGLKIVAESGTMKFKWTAAEGFTKTIDDFITVNRGATLELTGDNGDITNNGKLVFMAGAKRVFNDTLTLGDNSVVEINTSTTGKVSLGGTIVIGENMSAAIRTGVDGDSGNGGFEIAATGATVVVPQDSMITISAPMVGEGVLTKEGAGTVAVGLSRPVMDVKDGVVKVTAAVAEVKQGWLTLPLAPNYSEASAAKLIVFNEGDNVIETEGIEVIEGEEGAKLLKVTLKTEDIIADTTIGELFRKEDGSFDSDKTGVIIIRGGSTHETALTVTFDYAMPTGIVAEVSGHVTFVGSNVPNFKNEQFNFESDICLKLDKPFASTFTIGAEQRIYYAGTGTLAQNSFAGTGKLYFDVGEENELIVNAQNNFTGLSTLVSGTTRMGHINAFGSGANGNKVVVDPGATLDVAAINDSDYPIVLNGGTLTRSGPNQGTGKRQFWTVSLTADSFVHATSEFGSINDGHRAHEFALNGHKLTKTGAGTYHIAKGTFVGGGTFVVEEGTLNLFSTCVIPENQTVTIEIGEKGTLKFGDGLTVNGTCVMGGEGNVTGFGVYPSGKPLTLEISEKGALTFDSAINVTKINLNDAAAADAKIVEVLKVTARTNLPDESKLARPAKYNRWTLETMRGDLGYRLVRPNFILLVGDAPEAGALELVEPRWGTLVDGIEDFNGEFPDTSIWATNSVTFVVNEDDDDPTVRALHFTSEDGETPLARRLTDVGNASFDIEMGTVVFEADVRFPAIDFVPTLADGDKLAVWLDYNNGSPRLKLACGTIGEEFGTTIVPLNCSLDENTVHHVRIDTYGDANEDTSHGFFKLTIDGGVIAAAAGASALIDNAYAELLLTDSELKVLHSARALFPTRTAYSDPFAASVGAILFKGSSEIDNVAVSEATDTRETHGLSFSYENAADEGNLTVFVNGNKTPAALYADGTKLVITVRPADNWEYGEAPENWEKNGEGELVRTIAAMEDDMTIVIPALTKHVRKSVTVTINAFEHTHIKSVILNTAALTAATSIDAKQGDLVIVEFAADEGHELASAATIETYLAYNTDEVTINGPQVVGTNPPSQMSSGSTVSFASAPTTFRLNIRMEGDEPVVGVEQIVSAGVGTAKLAVAAPQPTVVIKGSNDLQNWVIIDKTHPMKNYHFFKGVIED